MSAKRNARATAFAVALLVILAVPTAALAAPKVPGAEPVVLTFTGEDRVCSFPVQLTILDGTRLRPGQGMVIVTGPLTVTVTNLDSGASQTFNASGPTFNEGQVLVGPAIILQPASAGLGEPFLIYNRGQTVDICAALS
jgi:hypothetical protein